MNSVHSNMRTKNWLWSGKMPFWDCELIVWCLDSHSVRHVRPSPGFGFVNGRDFSLLCYFNSALFGASVVSRNRSSWPSVPQWCSLCVRIVQIQFQFNISFLKPSLSSRVAALCRYHRPQAQSCISLLCIQRFNLINLYDYNVIVLYSTFVAHVFSLLNGNLTQERIFQRKKF